MAANTRYTPAPQRDSLSDADYPVPPPSYQDAPAPPTDDLPPRSADDNLPDDFKFGNGVASATLDVRMAFIRKVYFILTCQLVATAALASVPFASDAYRSWVQTHAWVVYASLFGALGMLGLTFWKRKSYPANVLFLSGFTALEAYTVSVVTSFYDARTVLTALLFALGIFVALTLFACQARYDFTHWLPWLGGALWMLILFGFMAAFFPYSSKAELGYGIAGALIFSAYILVDTQLVMRHYHVEEEIAAAIALYLDVLNLFLSLLRILNSSNNN